VRAKTQRRKRKTSRQLKAKRPQTEGYRFLVVHPTPGKCVREGESIRPAQRLTQHQLAKSSVSGFARREYKNRYPALHAPSTSVKSDLIFATGSPIFHIARALAQCGQGFFRFSATVSEHAAVGRRAAIASCSMMRSQYIAQYQASKRHPASFSSANLVLFVATH